MATSFSLSSRHAQAVSSLSDAQLGSLMRALFCYADNGDVPDFSDKCVAIAFAFIRADIDDEAMRRQRRCQRNRENAQKRWGKRQTAHTTKKNTLQKNAPLPKNEAKQRKESSHDNLHASILEYWNSHLAQTGSRMPSVSCIDARRRRLIDARISEYGSADIVTKAFDRAFVSPFLNGRNRDRWVANFDWILLPSNFSRVLDGNFGQQLPSRDASAPAEPKPASKEDTARRIACQAKHKAERQERERAAQRDNIMKAIKAAEQNPHSARAKVAYIAYADGTMKSLGILWTPTQTTANSTPYEPHAEDRTVAR